MEKARRWRVGVIGDPVAHSISPAMQQPALDALGIDATYQRWHTPAAELSARIASLRDEDVLGANVTVPHKLAVMNLVDEISEIAEQAGAVNTIINQDSRLFGDNTDVYGFKTSLVDSCPDVGSRCALVLGAGGAARAVVLALAEMGVMTIGLYNRDRKRAARIAADLGSIKFEVIEATELPIFLGDSSIVVNATSLGWHSGETPLEPDLLGRLPVTALVVDLTYRDTDLLLAARARELSTLDGLPMLVHQGARALELWTGRPAPVDIMMNAALAARTPS
jgi:shikimate dehydrogenase